VIKGVADGCEQSGCTLLGGETAELPGFYAKGEYDLAGFCVGIVEKARIITGKDIKPGDALIGFASSGLHSNGYSLARKILSRAAGSEGRSLSDLLAEQRRDLDDRTIGDALLAAHRSYLSEFRALREAAGIHALAHLTGGGWEGNLPRALPDDLGAEVDRATWGVPRVFTLLAELGRVAESETYDVWNMGVGIVFVLAHDDIEAALAAVPEAVELGRVVRHTGGRRVRFT